MIEDPVCYKKLIRHIRDTFGGVKQFHISEMEYLEKQKITIMAYIPGKKSKCQKSFRQRYWQYP